MKDLLQRLKGANGGQASGSTQRSLSLAAFGKHPGWDDHIPGIGLDTESLAYVKQTLYVTGIGGQIDAGAWEKLDWDKRLPGFDHLFLWARPGTTLLGQFWSSTDRKGRAKYPMVICTQGDGLEPAWMLEKLPPGLERLRDACRATPSADAVTNHCQVAQDQLRSLLNMSPEPGPGGLSLEARQQFFERPELGPDRVGLLRVLHELAASNITTAPRGATVMGGVHLRVPLAAASRNEGMLLWLTFLRATVPETVPVLLLARSGTDWLDLIIGEPSSDNFYCLQASAKAQPFSTAIPYELAPELPDKLRAIESALLGRPTPQISVPRAPVAAPPPPPKPAEAGTPNMPAPAAALAPQPKPVAPTEPKPPAPAGPTAPSSEAKPRSKAPWFVGGGLIALLALGVLVFLNTGQRPGAQSTMVAEAPLKTAPAKESQAQPKVVDTAAQDQAKAAALAAQREKDFQAATNAVARAVASQDFAEAARQAQLALEIKPNDAAALALASLVTEKKQAAEVAARQEKDYQSATNQAGVALASGNLQEATRQAKAALALKLADPVATALAAEADKRTQAAHVAAQKEKDFESAVASARTALTAKDYAAAIAQLTRALELKPGEPAASKLMVDARSAQKQQEDMAALEQKVQAALVASRQALAASNYDLALQQARVALELRPAEPSAAALVAEAQNRIQTAAAAMQRDKDFESAISAAGTAFEAKDFPAAVSHLNRALEKKPGDASATRLLADVQAAKKQQEDAAEMARKYEMAVNAARQALAVTNYDLAIREAGAALALKPGDAVAAGLVKESEAAKAAAEKVRLAATTAAIVPAAMKETTAEKGKEPWTNDLGMEFVWIPSVAGGAYFGKFEVTQQQYRKVMGNLPTQLGEGDDLPVSNVGYNNAIEFCSKLSEKGPGKYGLLTKEEWLALAELNNVPEGSAWQSVSNRLRSEVTSYGLTVPRTRPERVGSNGTSDNGLADILGNVREWVVPETSIGFAYDASRGGTTALVLKSGQWLQSRTGFRCVVRDTK